MGKKIVGDPNLVVEGEIFGFFFFWNGRAEGTAPRPAIKKQWGLNIEE